MILKLSLDKCAIDLEGCEYLATFTLVIYWRDSPSTYSGEVTGQSWGPLANKPLV